MESDFQCCLMGDIVFRSPVTIGITLTASGSDYAWSGTLDAGSWWPNALDLALYMVDAWNSTQGGSMQVRLIHDPVDTHYRRLEFTPETGFGTVEALTISVPDEFALLGLPTASTDLGSGSSVKYTGLLPNVLTPYWPPALYQFGVDNITGYSEMAHDGTMYSTRGQSQRTVTLSVALDRTTSFDETLVWMRLWRDRWTRGRSVTFYLDRSKIPESWDTTLSDCDILELPNSGELLDFSRMMQFKELLDYSREVQFVHRVPRDTSPNRNYNGLGNSGTSSRVTSWYRAEVGHNLVMDFAGLTGSTRSAALWMRVCRLPSSGNLVTDTASGWGEIEAFGLDSAGKYSVGHGGATENDVRPQMGEWTLLIINSSGGNISYSLNGITKYATALTAGFDGVLALGRDGGTIEVDFANIGLFTRAIDTAEALSLKRAGVSWDYANPTGSWVGHEPAVYHCGDVNVEDWFVSNSSTSALSSFLSFAVTPIWGSLLT